MAIWNLRYADDTTLLATSPEGLQHQVNELQRISLLFGLEINSAKTCIQYDGHRSCHDWNPKCVDTRQRNRKNEQVQILGVVGHG